MQVLSKSNFYFNGNGLFYEDNITSNIAKSAISSNGTEAVVPIYTVLVAEEGAATAATTTVTSSSTGLSYVLRASRLLSISAMPLMLTGDTRQPGYMAKGGVINSSKHEQKQNLSSLLLLGYRPGSNGGHSFVGLSPDLNDANATWYHLDGGPGDMAILAILSPEQIFNEILNKNAQITSKKITKDKYISAKATATSLMMTPILYNIKDNNCATNCSTVLRSSGYNPPNLISKHPKYLFDWFSSQP